MRQRPSREKWLMDMARQTAVMSTCTRLQVGAVAVRGGRILVQGYNGAPAGLPHCVCDFETPCQESVHAEKNVINFAARYGIALEGASLYITHSPCLSCAGSLINAGIYQVNYARLHRDEAGLHRLRHADVKVRRI